MTDLVTTFRAAQMAGVSRSQFQKKILSGDLKTFEGMIHLADLRKVFPDASRNTKADAAVDRMAEIKASATYQSKMARRKSLPDAEILMSHLEELSNKSLKIKANLDHSEILLASIADRLEKICDQDEDCQKKEIKLLLEWLQAETKSTAHINAQ